MTLTSTPRYVCGEKKLRTQDKMFYFLFLRILFISFPLASETVFQQEFYKTDTVLIVLGVNISVCANARGQIFMLVFCQSFVSLGF